MVRVRVSGRVRVSRVRLTGGLLPRTTHPIFYSGVRQIATFRH